MGDVEGGGSVIQMCLWWIEGMVGLGRTAEGRKGGSSSERCDVGSRPMGEFLQLCSDDALCLRYIPDGILSGSTNLILLSPRFGFRNHGAYSATRLFLGMDSLHSLVGDNNLAITANVSKTLPNFFTTIEVNLPTRFNFS